MTSLRVRAGFALVSLGALGILAVSASDRVDDTEAEVVPATITSNPLSEVFTDQLQIKSSVVSQPTDIAEFLEALIGVR